MSDASVKLRFEVEGAAWRRGLDSARGRLRRFTSAAREDVAALGRAFNTLGGRLAALGIGIGATRSIMSAARLDRNLIGYAQTAGVAVARTSELRRELYAMSRATGQSTEDLEAGFSRLVAGGLTWDQAMETIKGVNVAMGVTKAGADGLASALTVAAASFGFDLAKPGQALELLDKMALAGRLANAELQDLSPIFAVVGASAQRAGLSFEKTLALIEALSDRELDPSRLSTLTDATLRLFTDRKLSLRAGRAAGVSFFNADGSRREMEVVLGEMAGKFQALNTDEAQSKWIQRVFGQADRRTQRGLYNLLIGDAADRLQDFTREIENATGTLDRDLNDSLDNLPDQIGRLNSAIQKSLDEWTRPVRRGAARIIHRALDKDGLNLSGAQILGGGAAAAAMTIIGARYARGWLGTLLKGSTSLSTGVATGKALEAAAGIAPVFVTNWPVGSGQPGTGAPGTSGAPVPVPLPRTPSWSSMARYGWYGLLAFGAFSMIRSAVTQSGTSSGGKNPYAGEPDATRVVPRHLVSEIADDAVFRHLGMRPVTNNIELNMAIDADGRSTVESSDPHTRVTTTTKRGSFR